jgi:hypothetical protein
LLRRASFARFNVSSGGNGSNEEEGVQRNRCLLILPNPPQLLPSFEIDRINPRLPRGSRDVYIVRIKAPPVPPAMVTRQ